MSFPFVQAHPFTTFAGLAYAFTWSAWGLAFLRPGETVATVAHYAGGFGPLVAALVTTQLLGRPVVPWVRSLLRWRVPFPFWLFAFGFPIALALLASAFYALLGGALSTERLAVDILSYLPGLALLALFGGGNEEPGWRGFALPELQATLSPVVSTLLLGTVWALWHLPLLAMNPEVRSGGWAPSDIAFVGSVTLVSIAAHAFWYTWLYNRTGSVLLCMALHASYNAANGTFVLISPSAMAGAGYKLPLTIMTGVLLATVAALLLATKGQLGMSRQETAAR